MVRWPRSLRGLFPADWRKAALLSGLFFLTIGNLWLLKPIRSASLLANLGAAELPVVRLGTVVVVAVVVGAYSRVVNRLRRVAVARGAFLAFAAVISAFWGALELEGAALGAQRWFVWAVFILVDVYSTVMVGIFWIYTNDVVVPDEADRLYGPIGGGGILGGIVAGVAVDALATRIGTVDLLLVSAAICGGSAALVSASERRLAPRDRTVARRDERSFAAATGGLREVFESRYLSLIVGIVMAYEFTAATTDFAVNVVFERAFTTEAELARMFGRLGWIVSVTALAVQIVVVPLALPRKRLALLLPPLAMGIAAAGLAVLPLVGMAIALATADRGLNYSLHQATKETLYVPLTDAQRYKGKAVIDMFVDRLGKALSSVALIAMIHVAGVSITIAIALALVGVAVWGICAWSLGRRYAAVRAGERS